jgi:hypothetical protein
MSSLVPRRARSIKRCSSARPGPRCHAPVSTSMAAPHAQPQPELVLGGLLAVPGGKLAVMGRLGALSRRAGAVLSGSPTVARRLQQDLRAGGWAVRSIVRRLTGCSPISLVCLAVAHVGGPVAVRRGQIPLLRRGLAKPSRLQALTRAFLTCQRGLLPGVTAAEVPVLPMPAGQLEIAVDLISVGGALVTVGGFLIAVRSGLIPVRPVWSLSAFV